MNTRLTQAGGYLHVETGGRFDAASGRRCIEAVYAACKESGLRKVLFDARGISTPVSISERHELATHLVNLHDVPIRCVVLVPAALMTTKTLEHTATNRGARVRTTDSLTDACAWLEIPLLS